PDPVAPPAVDPAPFGLSAAGFPTGGRAIPAVGAGRPAGAGAALGAGLPAGAGAALVIGAWSPGAVPSSRNLSASSLVSSPGTAGTAGTAGAAQAQPGPISVSETSARQSAGGAPIRPRRARTR